MMFSFLIIIFNSFAASLFKNKYEGRVHFLMLFGGVLDIQSDYKKSPLEMPST